jgi:hypothetical protein
VQITVLGHRSTHQSSAFTLLSVRKLGFYLIPDKNQKLKSLLLFLIGQIAPVNSRFSLVITEHRTQNIQVLRVYKYHRSARTSASVSDRFLQLHEVIIGLDT